MKLKALTNILLDLPVQLSTFVSLRLPVVHISVSHVSRAMGPAIFGVPLASLHRRVAHTVGEGRNGLRFVRARKHEDDLHDVARHFVRRSASSLRST